MLETAFLLPSLEKDSMRGLNFAGSMIPGTSDTGDG